MIGHAAEIPESRAASDPGGRCISGASASWTNAEFADQVRLASGRLATLGIGAGDVVAAILPNGTELVILMFAVWSRRAILTPVNPVLTPDEVGYQLSDSAAKIVVTDEVSAGKVLQLSITSLTTAMFQSVAPHRTTTDTGELHDLALLVYTSGTTARPKGVQLSHANISAMANVWMDWLEITPADRCLLVLPLFHVNGIMVSVVGPLWAGASVAIEPRFDVNTFWDVVARERPTYFSAVPAILSALTALPADTGADASSLRFAGCGAAPASAELLASFEGRYGVPVVEGYGLTECTVAATIMPLHGPAKPGTVGVPLPGIDVALVDEDGNFIDGPAGEVVIRGETVMRGYLGRPDETAKVLRDGWLHTGDIGYFDPHGYLVISDRLKDMVIWGGENISSTEVERALTAHPRVRSAGVVGRPNERFGEEPVAFVVVSPGPPVSPSELIEFCESRIARFKAPRDVWIVEALPQNSVGKTLKSSLRARVLKE